MAVALGDYFLDLPAVAACAAFLARIISTNSWKTNIKNTMKSFDRHSHYITCAKWYVITSLQYIIYCGRDIAKNFFSLRIERDIVCTVVRILR